MHLYVACTLVGSVLAFVVKELSADVHKLPCRVQDRPQLGQALDPHPIHLGHPFPFQCVDRYPLHKGFPPQAGTMDIVVAVVTDVGVCAWDIHQEVPWLLE